MASRSRSAPCFCGSGRAFGCCCLRMLRQVRTLRRPESGCRWRLWRAFGPGSERILGREVAEHVCGGEFVWIGCTSSVGATWMIDESQVSLLDLLQDLGPPIAEWVIAQTLHVAGPALSVGPRVLAGSIDDVLAALSPQPPERLKRDGGAAEPAELAAQLLHFARLAEALATRLREVAWPRPATRGRRPEPGQQAA